MSGITYEHLRGLLFNRPHAVHPDRLAIFVDALAGRTGIAIDERWREDANARIDRLPTGARQTMRGPAKGKQNDAQAPYAISGSTAIIPVHGTLVNRGAWLGSYSGLTSTEGLRLQLRSAMANPDVQSVVLDIDSPGGQVAGAFETAALVRELAAKKRTIAVVDDMAASAGYALASAASKIMITPSGVAGSIGVVLLHLDHSARLDKAGIAPTLIHAGSKKVDANPYQPLPDGVRQDLQDEVDAAYAMFVDAVALGRPKLTPAAIRATEAACYVGQAAVDVGLADAVGSMETALAELAALKAPGSSALAGLLLAPVAPAGASPVPKVTADPAMVAAFLATASAPPAPPPAPVQTAAESWNEVIEEMNARAKRWI